MPLGRACVCARRFDVRVSVPRAREYKYVTVIVGRVCDRFGNALNCIHGLAIVAQKMSQEKVRGPIGSYRPKLNGYTNCNSVQTARRTCVVARP